jgi:hypothetical protein
MAGDLGQCNKDASRMVLGVRRQQGRQAGG